MKLTDEGLDAMLAQAGLCLAEPHDPSQSYRLDRYLRTVCTRCGVDADYRLKHIRDKNKAGEPVCRACHWLGWYEGGHDLQVQAWQSMLRQGCTRRQLEEAGVLKRPDEHTWESARALADAHGYDLVDLVQGRRRGDDVLLVRCRYCGRQTAAAAGRGVRVHVRRQGQAGRRGL